MSLSLLERLKAIKEETKSLKSEYLRYISDKSIPLSERWAVFVLADQSFKTHKRYGPNFSNLDREVVGHDRVIHMVRESTKNTCDLIKEIKKRIANLDDVRDSYDRKLLLAIDIKALKEEILAENCGSFTFDF